MRGRARAKQRLLNTDNRHIVEVHISLIYVPQWFSRY